MYSLSWFDLLFQILRLFKAPVKDILAFSYARRSCKGSVQKEEIYDLKLYFTEP